MRSARRLLLLALPLLLGACAKRRTEPTMPSWLGKALPKASRLAAFGMLALVLPLAGCVLRTGATHRHGGGAGDAYREEVEEVAFGAPNKASERPWTEDGIVADDDPLPPDESPGDGDDPPPPDELPGDEGDDGPDLFADPHTKRPGAKELEKVSAQRPVTFTAPDATQQPVRRDRRPLLPDPATLSVAFVRKGKLTLSAEAVFELEELLVKESGIKMLASLGQSTGLHVGLKELAAQAQEEGRDLLLVDVRDGTSRAGYLLHADSGILLARYVKNAKGIATTPASTGAAPDLCERLAGAYGRMTK